MIYVNQNEDVDPLLAAELDDFNAPRVQVFRWLRFLRQAGKIALTRANRRTSPANWPCSHSASFICDFTPVQ